MPAIAQRRSLDSLSEGLCYFMGECGANKDSSLSRSNVLVLEPQIFGKRRCCGPGFDLGREMLKTPPSAGQIPIGKE